MNKVRSLGAGGRARDAPPRWQGVAFIVASALALGATPILGKLSYEGGADANGLLLVRFPLTAVALTAFAVVVGAPRVDARAIAHLTVLGAGLHAGASVAFFTALTRAPAGLVTLLLYAYPTLVVVLLWLVRDNRPSAKTAAGVVASALGIFLLIQPGGGAVNAVGVALGLVAALLLAVYVVVSARWIASLHPVSAGAWVAATAAVAFAGFALASGFQLPETAGGALAIVAVALLTAIGVAGFFAGLKILGPSHAPVVATCEPLFTVGLAAIVLGETFAPVQAVGALLIIASAVVAVSAASPDIPTP